LVADDELEVVAAFGPPETMPPRGARIPRDDALADAVRSGTPLYVSRVDHGGDLLGGESLAVRPLVAEDEFIGALALSYGAGCGFDHGERATVNAVAELCVQSLAAARVAAAFAAMREATAAAERRARFLVE